MSDISTIHDLLKRLKAQEKKRDKIAAMIGMIDADIETIRREIHAATTPTTTKG